MAFMERIAAPITDAQLIVVRLLRHYCAIRDDPSDTTSLSRLVAFGHGLHVPPSSSVAFASVFQLAEALLGRRLHVECCCARRLSSDERAILQLLASPMPTMPGAGTPGIPHGLPGALVWAVLSARILCGEILPLGPQLDRQADGRPSDHAFLT